MYNNMVYTKSGQRGRKQPEVHHLYNALKFLEPTLQIDEHPNPTSKLECLYSADSPDPLSDAGSNLEHEDIKPTLTTDCIEQNDDQCANNMEHASETTAAKHDMVDNLDPESPKPFPTTIKKASLETKTTAAKHDNWDDLDIDDSKPTSTTRKASAKRRCIEQNDKQYANVTERALETTTTIAKHDTWDDLGKFVASNGREWAAENLKLAKKFKTDIYELVLNYQKQMT